jgi:hypothetical protein
LELPGPGGVGGSDQDPVATAGRLRGISRQRSNGESSGPGPTPGHMPAISIFPIATEPMVSFWTTPRCKPSTYRPLTRFMPSGRSARRLPGSTSCMKSHWRSTTLRVRPSWRRQLDQPGITGAEPIAPGRRHPGRRMLPGLNGADGQIVVPNPWVANRTEPDMGRIILSVDGNDEVIDVPADRSSSWTYSMNSPMHGSFEGQSVDPIGRCTSGESH